MAPMIIPRKLLSGPGPANAPQRILDAAGQPLLGHLHPEFTKIMDDIKEGIQYAFQTKNRVTLAVSATGHGAMETVVVNLIEKGDVVLVGCNGLWGERFGEMAERNGADVRKITKPLGQVFTTEDIQKGLEEHSPKMLFLTHGESSGATMQPLENIGELCHRYNCLLLVDSVAAMGGVPLHMDKWGIDVMYSGAQKVLSCPPGASPISLNESAWSKITNRKTKVSSFYFDLNWLANYWGCDEGPRKYHHTGPINNMYALREGLAILSEEGLEKSWTRHRECAEKLWAGLDKIGLELYVEDKAARLPTVNAVKVPSDVQWKHVSDYAMKNFSVELSGGLGALAGKVWRIGLMGYNATPSNVERILEALGASVEYCRANPGSKI